MIKNVKQFLKIRKKSIINQNKYQISSVLVPLITINNSTHILFQKRSKNVRQSGEICFPGGYYDEKKDISYKHTAIRETCEELLIKKSKIKLLGEMGTLITPMGILLNVFIGTLDFKKIENLYINKAEVESIFTLPISFFKKNKPEVYHIHVHAKSSFENEQGEKIISFPAKELGLPSRYYEAWEGKKYPVLLYKTEFGVIWGITAEITHEFISLI